MDIHEERIKITSTETDIQGTDQESFVRGVLTVTFFFFFLVEEGSEDPNITIRGPSLACQRNAICWCADDGPRLNACLVAL